MKMLLVNQMKEYSSLIRCSHSKQDPPRFHADRPDRSGVKGNSLPMYIGPTLSGYMSAAGRLLRVIPILSFAPLSFSAHMLS